MHLKTHLTNKSEIGVDFSLIPKKAVVIYTTANNEVQFSAENLPEIKTITQFLYCFLRVTATNVPYREKGGMGGGQLETLL